MSVLYGTWTRILKKSIIKNVFKLYIFLDGTDTERPHSTLLLLLFISFSKHNIQSLFYKIPKNFEKVTPLQVYASNIHVSVFVCIHIYKKRLLRIKVL